MSVPARYLLDTTVLIDISKEVQPISSHIEALLRGPDVVGVCSINVAEFFGGLAPAERAPWFAFVDRLTYWEISAVTASEAGILRYASARQGRTLSTQDALIAATAIQAGATLITRNVKDFMIPNLLLLPLPGES